MLIHTGSRCATLNSAGAFSPPSHCFGQPPGPTTQRPGSAVKPAATIWERFARWIGGIKWLVGACTYRQDAKSIPWARRKSSTSRQSVRPRRLLMTATALDVWGKETEAKWATEGWMGGATGERHQVQPGRETHRCSDGALREPCRRSVVITQPIMSRADQSGPAGGKTPSAQATIPSSARIAEQSRLLVLAIAAVSHVQVHRVARESALST